MSFRFGPQGFDDLSFKVDHVENGSSSSSDGTTNAVEMKNGSFSWGGSGKDDDDDDDGTAATVSGLNFSVGTGKLVAVVGSVGAGKTTILASMLGETEKLTGNVHFCNFLVYNETNFFNF